MPRRVPYQGLHGTVEDYYTGENYKGSFVEAFQGGSTATNGEKSSLYFLILRDEPHPASERAHSFCAADDFIPDDVEEARRRLSAHFIPDDVEEARRRLSAPRDPLMEARAVGAGAMAQLMGDDRRDPYGFLKGASRAFLTVLLGPQGSPYVAYTETLGKLAERIGNGLRR
jgi:hypothetical protein